MAVSAQQVSSSDFVKKLFKMLEDTSYQHVVRWGDMGDSFIVLDNNEFTKSVLPRHFKHSNFASFVRQLNKYDFHKVRNNEEGGVNPYGEGAWEFKHRDFQIHNKDLLENIKRKAPAAKKAPQQAGDNSSTQITNLQSQIESLSRYQDTLTNHLQGLSQQYQTVVAKMLNFQRTLSTQDNVMQNIIQYIVNPEANASQSRDNPFLPGEQAQKLISSYDEAAKASVDIMNDLSQLGASLAPNAMSIQQAPLPPPPPQPTMQHPAHLQDPQQYTPRTISPTFSQKSEQIKSEYHTPTREGYTSTATSPDSQSNRPIPPHPQQVEDPSNSNGFNGFGNFQFPPQDQPSGDAQREGGLRVFTVGHLAPRQDENDDDNSGLQHSPPNMPTVKEHDDRPHNALRVRRQTFVPGWAVPPKILLVDDDAVYRNMSSKFLQVFGCEADVAVDGFSALDKVNMEKYDLILMDVVMPNLDGISATNMIRQFDIATPIISMTSNIHSNDIMHYFNSGMNDVLPKPFTKDSLLGMLEKHLLHMKQMQQMQQMNVPAPVPQKRLVELPSTEDPNSISQGQGTTLEDSLSLDDPFSYDGQDYAAMFNTQGAQPPPQPQQAPPTFAPAPAAATGKRRTPSDRDPYEYLDQSRQVPRSDGGESQGSGKRVRYSPPTW